MRQIFSIVVLLLFSTTCFGQTSDNKQLQIRISPLGLIDPVSSVIQLGLQKQLNKRLAISIDYGFKYLSFYDPMNRKDYKYSKSRAELKYFVKLKNKSSGTSVSPYLAVEGLFLPQKFRKEDEWIFRDHKNYKYEYSNINRQVLVANLKFGKEVWINNSFIFDKYIGIGVRKLTITQNAFGEVESIYDEPMDLPSGSSIDWHNGIYYRPNLLVGFKIGYVLNKKERE